MKTWRLIFIAHAAVALILGLVAYLVLKENTYIHVFLKKFVEFPELVIGASPTVSLLRRFLADALWAYAMTFALSVIERETFSFIITSSTGVAWELCQRFHLVGGNFEIGDIITYVCASGIAVAVIKLIKKRRKCDEF